MSYFQMVTAADELKAAYRRLCKMYHPDKGGSVEQMQDINNEYEALMARFLSAKSDAEYGEGHFYASREQESEIEQKVRAAVERIAHLDGLDIEIIGAWVWVSGDTQTHKDALKAAEYWWMRKKEMWAYKGKVSHGKGNTSLEEMREKYGSQRVHTRSRRLSA
jgi:curved DNA-binding protein CbpA